MAPAKLLQLMGMVTSNKTQLTIMLDEAECSEIKEKSILWRIDADMNDVSYRRRISALEILCNKGPDASVIFPLLESLETTGKCDTSNCNSIIENSSNTGNNSLPFKLI
jgi:hypothetical protein